MQDQQQKAVYFRELYVAVDGDLEGKDWRCFYKVSHLRIADPLLYLFICLSRLHFRSLFIHLCFYLIWRTLSTDYCSKYKYVMSNFPLFLLSASQSWHRSTKCDPLSSVSAFVNYSHQEMSMSIAQLGGLILDVAENKLTLTVQMCNSRVRDGNIHFAATRVVQNLSTVMQRVSQPIRPCWRLLSPIHPSIFWSSLSSQRSRGALEPAVFGQ